MDANIDTQKPYLGFVAASAGLLDDVLKKHGEGKAAHLVNGVKGGHMF